jgi:hypothetical protein
MSKMLPATPTRVLPAATTARDMPLTGTRPTPWRRSSQRCCPPPPARTNPARLPLPPSLRVDDFRSRLGQDCGGPVGQRRPMKPGLSPTHDEGQTRRWGLIIPITAIRMKRWNSPSRWRRSCGRPLALPTSLGSAIEIWRAASPTRSTPILPPTLTRWDFQSAPRRNGQILWIVGPA